MFPRERIAEEHVFLIDDLILGENALELSEDNGRETGG